VPDAAAILARLDSILREVAALRDAVAASLPAPVADISANWRASNGLDADFLPEHLIEISTAAERLNRPPDSLRWACRRQGCGVKVAGRWLASAPKLVRY